MTSLLPSCKENQFLLNLIDESLKLFGISCTIYDVSSMNMYLDDRILSKGIPYKLLLQEYVDSRLLSNLKWSTIDLDKEAIIAFMPIQYCNKKYNLREFNVVEIHNGDRYQIREINKSYLIGLWYVVKMIPYRDEENRSREEKQMKTNFLKIHGEEIE